MSSPARALYRVFVLPALSKPHSLSALQATPALHCAARTSSGISPSLCRRSFSHTPPRHAKTREAEKRTQKWDSEITARIIYLVDPVTNVLEVDPTLDPETAPPIRRTRYDVLRDLDTRTHRLVQLSPDEPNNPHFIPVCKIVSKKDAYEAEKKRAKAEKEKKRQALIGSEKGMKTLEVNWAIDGNDLGHRLVKFQGFLREGRRVEVCFAAKKRGRRATREECEAVIEKFRGVADEEGAKERGGLVGKLGGVASLEFVGRVVKGSGGGGGGGDGGVAVEAEGQVEKKDA